MAHSPNYKFLLVFILMVFLTTMLSTITLTAHEPPNCNAGTGWHWVQRPSTSLLASEAEATLNRFQLKTNVTAIEFGEADSCGTFSLYETDLKIAISQSPIKDRQSISSIIQEALTPLAMHSRLGNVTAYLPNEETFTISYSETNLTPDFNLLHSASWQLQTPSVSPQGRYVHGMAYDAQRNVAVLFGGDNDGFSRLNDTWEYDGTNWQQINPPQSPPGRANIDQTLVYDAQQKSVVLFGGLGTNGYLNDTWQYDGQTWAQIDTQLSPSPRDSHTMVYDTSRNTTVLFGGYVASSPVNDTWEYNGSWKQVNTSQAPDSRFHHAMAYDANREVSVIFGGRDSTNKVLNDTWEYDGTNWQQINLPQSPPARENHSMVYDTERGVIVLFGGDDTTGNVINDTWEYNGLTWEQVTVDSPPTARKEMSLVYNTEAGHVLFFGGGYWTTDLIPSNETWVYQNDTSPEPAEVFVKNVYVVVYDPLLSNGSLLSDHLNWNNHETLTEGTINLFRQATNNMVNYQVVDTTIVTDGWPVKIDGFRYTEEEFLAVIAGTAPAHSPDAVDYNAIVNDPNLDICGRVNRGEIDEVWIYNGPFFGFYESTLVGPNGYFYNSPPVPQPHNCNRLIPIMGPSPERGVNSAVHNFGHRTESAMRQVYGSWEQNRIAHSWEKFALVDSLSPDFAYSGCGNTHFPPNGVRDYDYENPATASTNCDDFFDYPELSPPANVLTTVTCQTWGCEELGFSNYWYSRLPSSPGCTADGILNNWWHYILEPSLALNPSLPCAQFQIYLPFLKR